MTDAPPARTRARAKPPACVWILRDGTRCTTVAVDGDLCRPHAKKAAEGQLEAESAAALEPELIETEDEPGESGLGVNREDRSVSDLRAALTQDATAGYGKLWDLIDDALAANRVTYSSCVHCGKRTPVTVADMNARIQAAKLLIEQTAGRPASNEPTKLTELERRFEAVTSEAIRAMGSEELHAYLFWTYASRPDPEAFIEDEAQLQADLKAAVAKGGDVAGHVIAIADRRRAESGEEALTSEQKAYLREVYAESNRNHWRHV